MKPSQKLSQSRPLSPTRHSLPVQHAVGIYDLAAPAIWIGTSPSFLKCVKSVGDGFGIVRFMETELVIATPRVALQLFTLGYEKRAIASTIVIAVILYNPSKDQLLFHFPDLCTVFEAEDDEVLRDLEDNLKNIMLDLGGPSALVEWMLDSFSNTIFISDPVSVHVSRVPDVCSLSSLFGSRWPNLSTLQELMACFV